MGRRRSASPGGVPAHPIDTVSIAPSTSIAFACGRRRARVDEDDDGRNDKDMGGSPSDDGAPTLSVRRDTEPNEPCRALHQTARSRSRRRGAGSTLTPGAGKRIIGSIRVQVVEG